MSLVCLAAALLGSGAACNSPTVKKPSVVDGGPEGTDPLGGDGSFALPDGSSATKGDGGRCTAVTCTPAGGRYCGRIGDGCGGELECPDFCPGGESCGGGGVAHVCGKAVDPSCKGVPCTQPGGRLCGRVGDGCGRAIECGECGSGSTCGASAPNVCGKGGNGTVACEGLCKQQVPCAGGGTTRVKGVVLAPTTARFGAADPLYNAVVYVPNGRVEPIAPGVSCERCGTQISGQPLVTALSGPDGGFTLENVPAGKDIPLVVQIGRWRRQVKIPEVKACETTTLPIELTRLPRNQSEGDIPLMAIATGKWDPLECLLRKIGIDDSEFTLPTGKGRVHLFAYDGLTLGNGTPKGAELTGSLPTLRKYDVVLLPCDDQSPKPAAAQKNLVQYSAEGGRLFMTDWSHTWLKDGGPFESVATWSDFLPALGSNFAALVDGSFPKGQALADWLAVVKASTAGGQVAIHDPIGGISWYRDLTPPTQRWLYTDKPEVTEIFSFNTPVKAAAEAQCGRVVYSTFHVVDRPEGKVFPGGCVVGPMTPQEKVLEFMLFDVASCVQPDKEPPSVFRPPLPPPPVPPPVVR